MSVLRSVKERARVRHTPFPAERSADAGGTVAAAHLRRALQADGKRVLRERERVRDGAGRRVRYTAGGLHGPDRRARRALRGRADADPGRGFAALQAQQHPHRQGLLRRGGRVPRGGAGGGSDGARGGVHRPARTDRGGSDGGFGRDRDKAAVQEPLVRDRRPHRFRPGDPAADPRTHVGEGAPGEGQGAPLRSGREARTRTTGSREGPEKRPPARRLAPGSGSGGIRPLGAVEFSPGFGGEVLFGFLRQEFPDPAQVLLVHLVDEGFRRQELFAGRGLYALGKVLLDEPRHRGQDSGQDAEPYPAATLLALHEARRGEIELFGFVQRSQHPGDRLGVRELHLHVEALLARDVVGHPLHRAVGNVAHLPGEGAYLGHAQPELLHDARDVLRLNVDEVPDAVLPLEDDGETGDYVAQKALRSETQNGGQDGGPGGGGQRVSNEDTQDNQRHDEEDHVPQGVPDQGDGGVLAFDPGHGLRVQEVLPASPPAQDAGHPVRQGPEEKEPQEHHDHRREDVAHKLRAGDVVVEALEELSDRREQAYGLLGGLFAGVSGGVDSPLETGRLAAGSILKERQQHDGEH